MERSADAVLAERLAADPYAAFADVVAAHQDLVYGICLRITRDSDAADDIAQDAFVNAFRAVQRYPAERISALRLRPWLARIALNLARNHVRDRRPDEPLEPAIDPPAAVTDEPVNLAQRREERNLWARLLASLPARYRLAVVLRHVDGLSYAELSEVLRRPVGTVKSDVHRGVALLRAAHDAEQRRLAEAEQRLLAELERRQAV